MANYYTDNPNLRFHLNHPLLKEIIRLRENDFAEKDEYDYACRNYEDAIDTYDSILGIVGDICSETIEPNAKSVDEDGPEVSENHVHYARGTKENLDALVNAGLMGMSLPRKFGGLNFPLTPYVISNEMVSRADAGFANIWGLQDCAETLREFASDDIIDEYLPMFQRGATGAMALTEPDAGSDLQAVQLKATYNEEEDQWYLNGVKRFITNGDADISLVLARSEEGTSDARGLSLFVYDRKSNAVKVRRIEHKLGIIGSPTCELVYKDAPARLVGSRRMGLIKYVMSLMNAARLGIGAQSVGISEAAYREALKYAHERAQFGKPVMQFPAVYEMLTDMKIKIDAQRSLLYETTRFIDMYKAYAYIQKTRKLEPDERKKMKYYMRLADVYTPMLKLISSEYCNKIAYDSIQVHGGTGYMQDFPVERLYRDARITSIYEGTSQLQVVAAIRGVTTEIFLNRIREYENMDFDESLLAQKNILLKMTTQYVDAVQKVIELKHDEYLDFHARRLVEMAANIIMGYLLILDASRDSMYKKTAELFVIKALAENNGKSNYISIFKPEELDLYRIVS